VTPPFGPANPPSAGTDSDDGERTQVFRGDEPTQTTRHDEPTAPVGQVADEDGQRTQVIRPAQGQVGQPPPPADDPQDEDDLPTQRWRQP
jgi:hypothetical protein